MLRKVKCSVLILFLALAVSAFADQITLKNGDHLTGKIVKSDGWTLVLHTDSAGDVSIDLTGHRAMTQAQRGL